MNLKRSLLFTWTLIIACIVLIPAAWAQYPEKPINLIVGFKAGGTSDSVARFLAKSLQTQLGQPVLVVNNPGGGETLAATTVKKSAPDGYSIAVITNTAYTFMPYFMAMQKKALSVEVNFKIGGPVKSIMRKKDSVLPFKAIVVSRPGLRAPFFRNRRKDFKTLDHCL